MEKCNFTSFGKCTCSSVLHAVDSFSFEEQAIFLTSCSISQKRLKTPQKVVSGDASKFDFIWFTPSTEETSLCDRLGKDAD